MHATKIIAFAMSMASASMAAPTSDAELEKRAMHRVTVCDGANRSGACSGVDIIIAGPGGSCTNFATWNDRIRSVHGWGGGPERCRFYEHSNCGGDFTLIYRGGGNIQGYLQGKITSAQCYS